MPTLYMLIGVPGSGKSTWIASQPFDWTKTVIASTDGHLDRVAKEKGITYDDAHKAHYNAARKDMNETVRAAVKNGWDIVWDQTNVESPSRKKKLAMIPPSYSKVAVVFPTPAKDELKRRLASRPGKTIAPFVINMMIKALTVPAADEGFDKIITL